MYIKNIKYHRSKSGSFILPILCAFVVAVFSFKSAAEVIITDAESGTPLAKASVFDKEGVFIAVSDDEGKIPSSLPASSFPLNIRYVGYQPVEVSSPDEGIITMTESTYVLPELTVDDVSRNHLYLQAYERNYQSALDPNDTISYFTERIVDFVLPLSKKAKNKGWKKGRVLGERIYTHVKQKRKDKSRDTLKYQENKNNKSYNYEMDEEFIIPEALLSGDSTKVIIPGKYYPMDVWTKLGDNYVLNRDNLSDEKNHVYSPTVLKLLGGTADFTRDEQVYNFIPDGQGHIKPDMISEVAYYYDVTLKGKVWKWVSEQKEEIPLQSYGELYIIDRAYLTADEVKELKKNPPVISMDFSAPDGISEPPANILKLKEEVKAKYPKAH